MKKRDGKKDITDFHIHHLVFGRDYFGRGFGTAKDILPSEGREEARAAIREKMRKAWQDPDVRRRVWESAEKEGKAVPWAAQEFGDPDVDAEDDTE